MLKGKASAPPGLRPAPVISVLSCWRTQNSSGKITVPIAATFPLEKIRDAVALQAGRHVHGKIVVTL